MNKKVYAVTKGQYSDEHIIKVCTTKQIAERVIEDLIKEDWNENGYRHQRNWEKQKLDYQKAGNFDFNSYRGDWYESFDKYRQHELEREYDIEEYEVLDE